VIIGVFGIDERPQATPRLRRYPHATAPTSYTPPQIAAAYNFPSGVSGAGETVAIIELGGGYSQSDLARYFHGLGIAPPSVAAVSVDGGSNAPGSDADGEVMLDIEVVGAVAPGAKIAVYFAPNTARGLIDAISTAIHDSFHQPSVVSISWGDPEDGPNWTAQARTQIEHILTEGAILGVTVTVAAGDAGSADGANDGKQHVDFPASAPHALGCGGTSLQS